MLSVKIMKIPNEDKMLIELCGVESSEQEVLTKMIQSIMQVETSNETNIDINESNDLVPSAIQEDEINEKEYKENQSSDVPDFVKEAESEIKNSSQESAKKTTIDMSDYVIMDLPYGTAADTKNRQIILNKAKEKDVNVLWKKEFTGFICKKEDIEKASFLKKYIRKNLKKE